MEKCFNIVVLFTMTADNRKTNTVMIVLFVTGTSFSLAPLHREVRGQVTEHHPGAGSTLAFSSSAEMAATLKNIMH